MSERGQATVEFVGAIPVLVVVVLIAWQFVLAGHAAWLAGAASRAAARAELVGDDPEDAAERVLPDALERGLEVRPGEHGRVDVRVPVPFLHPAWEAPLQIGAGASLEARP